MKDLKTITIAAIISFAASSAAMAGAIVYERPADNLQPADQGMQKAQKVTPTDQPTAKASQGPSNGFAERAGVVVFERPVDALQPGSQGAQKVQKVTPTDQPGIQALQSPTGQGSVRAIKEVDPRPSDLQSPTGQGSLKAIKEVDPRPSDLQSPTGQESVRAGDILLERPAGVAGQVTRDDPFFQPGQQKVQKVQGLNSLSTLRSAEGMFATSRGGDQGNGALLPAIRATGAGAVASVAGKGAVGTPDTKAPSFSPAATGAGAVAKTTGGAALHLKPAGGGAASAPVASGPGAKAIPNR